MTEVRRNTLCPTCGRRFLIAFDPLHPFSDEPTRVDCPRFEQGTPCLGHVITQLPEIYVVRLPPD